MTVAATVVVQFGDGADSSALVVVELDEVMNVDLNGEEKTSFVPGDIPYLLVHHDATVRIGQVACSSGMVSPVAMVSRERSQQLQWPDAADSQELPHLPAGVVSWKWYGNVPLITRDGRTLTASGAIPAIGEASYAIDCHQYRLIPPVLELAADESYPVLIVITMEAA